MRISGQETTNIPQRPENLVRSNDVSRTRSSEGVENNSVDSSNEVLSADRVELSAQARYIQRVREVAQEAPEIRANRVEEAQRAVQNDTLNLNSQVLADRIVQNTLPS